VLLVATQAQSKAGRSPYISKAKDKTPILHDMVKAAI
jgi:hypothetical protein